MYKLHKWLNDEIAKYLDPRTALANIVIAKIKKSGHHLSKEHERKIRKEMLTSQLDKFSMSFDDKCSDRKEIKLEIDDNDINEYAEYLTQAIKKTIPELAEELGDELVKETKRGMRGALELQHHEISEFEWRLRHYWGRALDRFELFLGVAAEIGENENKRLRGRRPSKRNKFLVEVLTRQQARACQVGKEILKLLESGFGDGALARWRTLHEIAVISLFISEHGNHVAERYLNHEVVESYKAAEQFNKFADKLGYKPFSERDIKFLKKQVDEVCGQFGEEFKNPYGWASVALKKGSPTFSDIEDAVSLGHIRPYYKMASHNVHAQPKSIFYKTGLLAPGYDVLLAGPSNVGLDEAGSLAIASLTFTTMCLLTIKTSMDSLVSMHALNSIGGEIPLLFQRVQRRIEQDERKHLKRHSKQKRLKK